MKRRPALISLLILSIGLAVGMAVKRMYFTDPESSVQQADQTNKTQQELIDESSIKAEDIELVQGQQGALSWKLLATSAKYNQGQGLVGVERPQLTAFYGEDRKEVYVRGDRGIVDQRKDNLTLYENVGGRFGDMELEAKEMEYLGSAEMVYLKGGVTVRRPDMTLTADTVEINLATRQMLAAGNVVALLASNNLEGTPFKE
ncbi:LPS export ABC transporter periplasmic protein LptC [Pseudodesulfovibrio profundus]|uniref:LPS export ABC transporter periplasmic protein LptC n=1 Tax=Pseudodesulfovibrio profundus TaxID=57320 RepID=A0A2C8F5B5_9BACT|nr:LPS export ABC transporter periplasmic protein LptC [Pseudodesulfovibrio profundus]MBC18368.1 LPS export ABC transporter periplasmic protein LptC [Desulfovibrio sp.]SOB57210.1 LPS export ABC transporter periplasmic protein LptC [Pseudodesulfovibrio profundus]|tara:strand:+ start:654 stop:1259 length:606 start_codon:yes stop_codon:yes gene_type:complete